MKKIFPFSILLLSSVSLKAQQYIPFPLTDAEWNVVYYKSCNGSPADTSVYNYQFYGDTTISGIVYKKVGMKTINVTNNDVSIIGVLREDQKKVYYKALESTSKPGDLATQESVLFDFNLSTGDTIPQAPGFESVIKLVQGVDSILINGIYHRRISIGTTAFDVNETEYWVEGLGSTTIGFLSRFTPVPTCSNYTLKAVCTKLGGNIVYLNPQFLDCNATLPLTSINSTSQASMLKIYPNPTASNDINISDVNPVDDLQAKVIDLTGRILLTQVLTQKNNNIKLPKQVPFCMLILTDKSGQIVRCEKIINQ